MNTLADSHIHLFADGYPGPYGRLFPRGQEQAVYEAFRQVHQIDAALIVGYEGDPWAAGHNRHIARLAQKNSWMAPIAYCPPDAPPTLRQCEAWAKAGHLGLSLYVGTPALARALTRWPREVWAWLNDRRAILSFNVPLTVLPVLAPLWPKVAECQILLSHLGLPDPLAKVPSARQARQLLEPVRVLGEYSQIGVKLSGFYALCPHPHAAAEPLVPPLREEFGAERLYWGSDFSPALDTVSFPQTIEAVSNLLKGARERRLVMGDNLRQLIARARAQR